MERFTLFWNGPFSQWAPSYFTLDGEEYNCAEQYMMARKAERFEDWDTHALIMEAEDPGRQKALGRIVDGFDKNEWEAEEDNGMPFCWNVVWRGNMAKFSQHGPFRRELLRTAGTTLVEASPHDRIWGIGLDASHPGARSRSTWRGTNWLGEVLTDVRGHLHEGVRILE